MISVICCYSDLNKIESMLKKSLDSQELNFETIFVDNTKGRFSSAAAALNYGFDQSSGEYVVFVHQDIIFDDKQLLNKIQQQIDNLGGNVIVGPAGIREKNNVYSNITHGPDKKIVGKNRLSGPVKVQTLDEVLLAMKREIFSQFRFDEKNCDNWHLYGVDLCLSAYRKGIESYAIPLEFHHLSSGNVDNNYMRSLGKIVAKHKDYYDSFITTISPVRTKNFNTTLFAANYRFKHFLAPKLKKIGISKDLFRKKKSSGGE